MCSLVSKESKLSYVGYSHIHYWLAKLCEHSQYGQCLCLALKKLISTKLCQLVKPIEEVRAVEAQIIVTYQLQLQSF